MFSGSGAGHRSGVSPAAPRGRCRRGGVGAVRGRLRGVHRGAVEALGVPNSVGGGVGCPGGEGGGEISASRRDVEAESGGVGVGGSANAEPWSSR